MKNTIDYINENDTMQDAIECLRDDLRDEIEEIITDLNENELLELVNEFQERNNYTIVCRMDELDDYLGKLYPSEFFEKFDKYFDFEDNYYTCDYNDFTSGNDILELAGMDNEDLINACISSECSTYETCELVNEYEEKLEEIQETFEEYKEGKQKQKAMDELTGLMNQILINASSKDVKQITAFIWNNINS